MKNLCIKHKLNPKIMKDFIDETIRQIKLGESAKQNDAQYKIAKPYIEAIKDLLKNGDIKNEKE